MKNRKVWIAIVPLFLFMVVLNFMTPYVADDFSYMYSFRDNSRVTNFFQIFPSLYTIYMVYIGRIVPHFLAQLFLMGPKWIFNIVNSLVFVGTVGLLYYLTGKREKFSLWIWCAIPMLLWVYTPSYGQIYLWMDGSFNYLWSYLFALLYLLPYFALYLDGKRFQSRGRKIGFYVYCLLWGAYAENVSFPVIAVSSLIVLILMIREKSIRKFLDYVWPIVIGAIGYLTIVVSPGERSHMGGHSLAQMGKNLIDIWTSFYTSQKLLLIVWTILMILAVYHKADKKRIVISILFVLMTVLSVSVLCMGTYFEDRSLAAGVFFLVASIVNLLQVIRQNVRCECVAYCICGYFIVANLLTVWDGCYDVYDTNRRNAAREELIVSQQAEGETVVTVPKIYAATKYCAKNGLVDIKSAQEDTSWPNHSIAKYYGLEMIYGE